MHLLGQLEVGCHEERRPVDGVKLQDVFSDDVTVARPQRFVPTCKKMKLSPEYCSEQIEKLEFLKSNVLRNVFFFNYLVTFFIWLCVLLSNTEE
jgi:hypothetical protein